MMEKKSIKQKIIKKLFIVLLVLITLILIINIPIITLNNNLSENDYNNWMSETLDYNQRVVDVAMLGAHDAFTKDINLFSKLDSYESNTIMQGVTGLLVKGFIYRQSKTQNANATDLLNAGVRYLDIRLTLDDDIWYTKHNYISFDFREVADEMTLFLGENPGEFLILDFQHITGVDYDKISDYNLFYDMLDEYGLLSYAYDVNQLGTLTYGQLTNNGTAAKIIIVSKFVNSDELVLPYDNSIRSNWADSDDFEYVLSFLQDEAKDIENNNDMDCFRVMQAVTTMQMSGSGILKALGSWSLINRAKDFNSFLVDSEGFKGLMLYLPIIMVDNANTNSGQFNDKIMQIIMSFDQNS